MDIREQAKKIVIEILEDEVNGRASKAREKMHKDYSMTWMYKNRKNEIFPSWKPSSSDNLDEVYAIKGRSYEIFNMAISEVIGDKVTVFVELIERYPDQKTNKIYQTPLVLVLEVVDGKIKTGRHYCDHNISFEDLNKGQIDLAYKGENKSSLLIESGS